MQSFGFAALGLVFGIVLCLISFSAYLLYSAARSARAETSASQLLLQKLVAENSTQLHTFRSEFSLALSKLDAAQLHEASLGIQRSHLRLARTSAMLHKLAYSFDPTGQTAQAAEEITEEDFSPFAHKDQEGNIHPSLTLSKEELSTYSEALRQRAQDKQRVESIPVHLGNPLPDIQEGFEQDEREAAELGVRAFAPEGGFV